MANHVSDTWQAMCHNAWQRPMHVGHMECHVSTCMAYGKGFIWGVGAVHRRREQQEGKGREKKKEGERKERKRGKEKREREGEERERRKKRKKEKEERERKEEKEGVSRSEQTRMAKNQKLRYKR